MEGGLHPETALLSYMKGKDAIFAAIPYRFCGSGRIHINVLQAKGSISMTRSHPNKQHVLLSIHAKLQQLTEQEKEENVL